MNLEKCGAESGTLEYIDEKTVMLLLQCFQNSPTGKKEVNSW